MKWKLSWLVSAGFGIAMVLVAVVSGVAYMNTLELIRDIRLVARTQEVSGQIETVFGLPGLGSLTKNAIVQRDYPQVQANVMLIATIFVATNLVVDMLYAWLDPRIRYS